MTFDEPLVRANLEVSGRADVLSAAQTVTVEVVRVGDWGGSPMFGHYSLLLLWSRLWRLVRRERRWAVRVARAGESGQVVEVAPSRTDALEVAVRVVADLAERPAPAP